MHDRERYPRQSEERYLKEPDDFEEAMSRSERARLRERRLRRRRARRRRDILLAALVLALGVAAGAGGVYLAGADWEARETSGARVRGKSAPRAALDSAPAGGAGARAEAPSAHSDARVGEGEGGHSWVSFRMPEPVEKRSDAAGPRVAIVVDDVGNTTAPLSKWLAIDAPLSFSVLPYPPLSTELSWRLYQAGYAIMMHLPTENQPPNSFSGKGQLSVGMSEATVFETLEADLAAVPPARGMNNHQGGRGCDDLALMTAMCEWAESRGLYVVDSSSSARDKVTEAALSLGMPRRKNQVFIDHDNDPDYIRKAMLKLAELARRNGTAIGICHWHRPNTPTVVGEMVRTLRRQGIGFSFARDVTN